MAPSSLLQAQAYMLLLGYRNKWERIISLVILHGAFPIPHFVVVSVIAAGKLLFLKILN